MGKTRQEETEEAALCRELYGLHFSSGNDSTRVYQHLMESFWGARTRIQEQESRIQRLTRTLQDIQKFMEHEPSEPPMSLKAGIILGWIEDGLGKESFPSRCHSFSSEVTQTLDTHNMVECTTTRGCGDKDNVIGTIISKLMDMQDRPWLNRFEVKDKFFLAESYIQQLTTLTGSEYNPPEVLCILTRCLPVSYRERILTQKNAAHGDWDLKQFRKAVMKIIQDDDEICSRDEKIEHISGIGLAKNLSVVHSQKQRAQRARQRENRRRVNSTKGRYSFQTGDSRKRDPCVFCEETSHLYPLCPLDTWTRARMISLKGKCALCLNVGHPLRECFAVRCQKCGGKHHSLIHFGNARQAWPQRHQGPQNGSYLARYDADDRWRGSHLSNNKWTPYGNASLRDSEQGTSSMRAFQLNLPTPRWQTKNHQLNAQE